MYGDNSYRLVTTGSLALSANTAHNIFNSSSALLSQGAYHAHILSTGNNLRLFGNIESSSVNPGYRLVAGSGTYVVLPPMARSALLNLHLVNETPGSNGTVLWALWERVS